MSRKRFATSYELGETLGAGSFATVKKGKSTEDGKEYAIKVFKKGDLSDQDTAALFDEIDILQSVQHDNIIRLYEAFDEPGFYYLVTELVMGGELFDRIVQKSRYTEKEARNVFRTLLQAVGFCHNNRIAHRDLKPENLLLLNEQSDTDLKLADFGFAKRIPQSGYLMTPCGTPRYVAPEIVTGTPYTTKADMWSLGVIIYILLSGYTPFGGKPREVLFRRIVKGKFVFHDQHWGNISHEAKDLITCLLKTDADERFDANQAISHKWISFEDPKLDTSEVNLDMLRIFQLNKKFKLAAFAVGKLKVIEKKCSLTRSKKQLEGIPDFSNVSNEPPPEEIKKKFEDLYDLGESIGSGSFAEVKEAVSKEDGSIYAVKIMKKGTLTPQDEQAIKDEIDILSSLKHDNIIELISFYDEEKCYYLVTELVLGGELFERIVKKTHYTEKEARDASKALLHAVAFCCSNNVAHRDLKPENLLLLTKESDSDLKLADFGFAKRVTSEECLKTQCGTPEYVAPEIISGTLYGTQCDMWSLGVITYILLAGYLPFHGSTVQKIFFRVVSGEYKFHDQYWANISPEAKDFVTKCLTVDPKLRMNADDALKHDWILKQEFEESKDLTDSIVNLKKFNANRKFRAVAKTVMLTCSLQRKLESLGPMDQLKVFFKKTFN